MKMHSDNPPGNAIGPGTSEESLKQAINESGYPLQAVAADQLQKTFAASKVQSFLIQEEWPYIDGDTGTVRSLDIHAEAVFETRQDTYVRPVIDLLIECKQIELPTVFFVRPKVLGPRMEYPRIAGNPHDLITVVSSPDSDRYSLTLGHILGFESHEFNTLPTSAISMARVHRRGGGRLELSGEDTYPNIVRPLAKATDYFEAGSRPNPMRQVYFDLHMLFSVAIIRGPMIGTSSSDDDDELTYVPWVRLHRLEPSNSDLFKVSGQVRPIHIVHASYLDAYVRHLLSFSELMSQRIRKISIPIIWGDGRVPKNRAEDFLSDEIFRILRPTVTIQTFQREMQERMIRAHSSDNDG